jgi:hypothetical protein|uniref:Uncharacterized protein n=1 Tax=Fagus sylvatica TaxID=28930 RepID=A0A2N9J6R8_FAGSY
MAASTSTEKAFVPGSDEQFILEKNSDCFLDMKSQKTWKRIVFGHGDFQPTSFHASKKPRTTLRDDDQIIDEDYKNFLHALNKYGEEQEKGKESAANDEDGDCYMDPAYKMFLDNLREDGRSYLLDISGIVHIKYKEENNTLSDENGNNWETLKDKNKSNLATPREEHRKKSAIPTAKDRIGGGSSLNSESYHLSLNRRKLDDIAADFLARRGKQPKSQNVGGETLLHSTKFATNSAVCTLFIYNFS